MCWGHVLWMLFLKVKEELGLWGVKGKAGAVHPRIRSVPPPHPRVQLPVCSFICLLPPANAKGWQVCVCDRGVGEGWILRTRPGLNSHYMCAQSCPTLCYPRDCSPPGSSVCGILQAGTLGQVAISSFRGSSWPRDLSCISCVSSIGRQVLYHCTTSEPPTPSFIHSSNIYSDHGEWDVMACTF